MHNLGALGHAFPMPGCSTVICNQYDNNHAPLPGLRDAGDMLHKKPSSLIQGIIEETHTHSLSFDY
jgi:hypothetical protein